MTDTPAPRPRATSRVRLAIIAVVAGLALAIAAWVYLGNASTASECPAQEARAIAIGDVAVGELAALNGTGQGRGYQTMGFKDAAGKALTIADFKGKKLLVNFWASWCVPCREEMPALDEIASKYNSEQFMVLPINLDIGANGQEKAEAFLADNSFANLPLYADNTFAAFERLKQQAVAVGLPATLLLDENGCELAVLQGPAEWNTPDGEAVIQQLLKPSV